MKCKAHINRYENSTTLMKMKYNLEIKTLFNYNIQLNNIPKQWNEGTNGG
jgi:hypothetical protein